MLKTKGKGGGQRWDGQLAFNGHEFNHSSR